MSGGALFLEAVRLLTRSGLDEGAQAVLLAALEAAREGGPLDLIYDCGSEAGLAREPLHRRGAAIFFSFAAGNLADDIADGDCTYLAEPVRSGPCVQFMLQNLFVKAAAGGGVAPDVLAAVAADLVRAAGPQLVELRTGTWTEELTRSVGEAIAGLQYSAYLRLLWAGTPLEPRAGAVGVALGVASHVAKDIATHDARMDSLPAAERARVVAWARKHAERLRGEGMPCLAPVLRFVDPALAGGAP